MVEVMKIMVTSFKRFHACTAILIVPNPAEGHPWHTPPLETPGHFWASLGQSVVGPAILPNRIGGHMNPIRSLKEIWDGHILMLLPWVLTKLCGSRGFLTFVFDSDKGETIPSLNPPAFLRLTAFPWKQYKSFLSLFFLILALQIYQVTTNFKHQIHYILSPSGIWVQKFSQIFSYYITWLSIFPDS